MYNSILWKLEYETYYTGATITADAGAQAGLQDAARLLDYFLSNKGETQTIAFARMNLENYQANAHMVNDMNNAIKAAQHFFTFTDSSSLAFTTTEEQTYNISYDSTVGNAFNNWYQAIHGYRTWYSCQVSKSGNSYTMIMNYHMRDFYDWDPNSTMNAPLVSQTQMYTLHCAGMAKHFKVVGEMKMNIVWTQGQSIGNGASYTII